MTGTTGSRPRRIRMPPSGLMQRRRLPKLLAALSTCGKASLRKKQINA
jgi:hypothetical protein